MKQSSPSNTKARLKQQDNATTTQLSQDENDLYRSCASNKWRSPFARNYGTDEVLNLLGGSKATHYNRLNPKSPYYDHQYPKPIKNGRLSIFLASEVATYLAGRISARDSDP